MKGHMSLAVAIATVCGLAASSQAALVYQNTFAGSGTPAVTTGGGTIGVTTNGGTSSTTFSSTGGIDGNGALNTVSTYGSAFGSALGSTSSTGGTALTNLATVTSQVTVTFWVKTAGTATDGSANFGRLFVLGPSGLTDSNASSSLALQFRTGKLDLVVNGTSLGGAQSKGNTLAGSPTWNFIALTYDGTAGSDPGNDAVQNAILGTNSNNNAQLYEGTDTTATSRFGIYSALATNATTGPLALGNAAALLLTNRTDLTRGVTGSFDDFRIYDSVLTPAQVEAVRTSALAPEPASLAAVAVGGIALLRRRRRAAN